MKYCTNKKLMEISRTNEELAFEIIKSSILTNHNFKAINRICETNSNLSNRIFSFIYDTFSKDEIIRKVDEYTCTNFIPNTFSKLNIDVLFKMLSLYPNSNYVVETSLNRKIIESNYNKNVIEKIFDKYPELIITDYFTFKEVAKVIGIEKLIFNEQKIIEYIKDLNFIQLLQEGVLPPSIMEQVREIFKDKYCVQNSIIQTIDGKKVFTFEPMFQELLGVNRFNEKYEFIKYMIPKMIKTQIENPSFIEHSERFLEYLLYFKDIKEDKIEPILELYKDIPLNIKSECYRRASIKKINLFDKYKNLNLREMNADIYINDVSILQLKECRDTIIKYKDNIKFSSKSCEVVYEALGKELCLELFKNVEEYYLNNFLGYTKELDSLVIKIIRSNLLKNIFYYKSNDEIINILKRRGFKQVGDRFKGYVTERVKLRLKDKSCDNIKVANIKVDGIEKQKYTKIDTFYCEEDNNGIQCYPYNDSEEEVLVSFSIEDIIAFREYQGIVLKSLVIEDEKFQSNHLKVVK